MASLIRIIKKDSKGLYVNYGGCRIRPFNPRDTYFRLDDKVNLVYRDTCWIEPKDLVKVFRDKNYCETWKRKSRNRQIYKSLLI